MSIQDRAPSTKSHQLPLQRTALLEDTLGPATGSRGVFQGPVLAALRVVMGLTFLWAFADKMFGLGYTTKSAAAWIHGGSPTKGFLGHAQVGPAQSMLRSWAGTGWVDWLFMLALLGVGLAFLLGIGMRLAATAGTLLLASMWIAEWPLARSTSAGAATSSSNPLIDYHLIYLVVVIALAVFAAGDTWGLGRRWARLEIVQRYRWLR